MKKLAKKLAGYTSDRFQQSLKRYYFARQVRRGVFKSDEPEYVSLDGMVSEGDWVIDVGANVGHYTLRLSHLVKSTGRVFAFEPIPYTFELLASNCALSPHRNITLINAAASDSVGITKMEVPEWERGGSLNYYEARISNGETTGEKRNPNSWGIFTLKVDALNLPHPVSLVKIDAEGHEVQVIQGMLKLIESHHPVLIVEGKRADSLLKSLGYSSQYTSGSANQVWRFGNHQST